jgi:flagellar hook protein FlgE
LEIYDSFGSRHDFKIHYAKIATNRWSVELAAVDTKDVLVSGGREDGLISYGTLVFNGEANLETISGPIINPVTISWENRAANNVVTLDFGKTANENQIEKAGDDNNSAKMTQFAGSYDSIVNQNGVSPADRESITIDNDGKVIVNFRNGLSRAVFKIPLATFPNPGGLNGLDGNVFSSNVEAGTLNLREAATGDAGTIAAGRLEQSNVDLAEELSNIVQAQRLYEANAQVAGIHSDILKLLGRIFD